MHAGTPLVHLRSLWRSCPLDLLPGTKPGEVRVLFRGQRVAGAKLKLHPPASAEHELTSDVQDVVRLGELKDDG